MLTLMKRLLATLTLVAVLVPGAATATSYTPCLRLSLPTPADPAVANSWGTLLNNNFSFLDTTQGQATISVAGSSNVTLTANNGSADQSRYGVYVFSGALTGNIDVLFPQGGCGIWSVGNGTTGAFTLSVGISNGSGGLAGNSITIPQNQRTVFYTDGTNVGPYLTPNGVGAAADGANADITSLSGLTTPLSKPQGGTGNTTGQPSGTAAGVLSGTFPAPGFASAAAGSMLGNTSTSPGTPSFINIPTLSSQTFVAGGTFTTSSSANFNTVFDFRICAGGGQGGKGNNVFSAAGGGGSGGCEEALFSGFGPSASVTVTIGAGGSGGSTNGGNGGTSSITYNANVIMTCSGGIGGTGTGSGSGGAFGGGAPGTCSASSGGGAGLVDSHSLSAQPGGFGFGTGSSAYFGGNGGGSAFGSAGLGGSSGAGAAGTAGAGGGGSSAGSGTSGNGGGGIAAISGVL